MYRLLALSLLMASAGFGSVGIVSPGEGSGVPWRTCIRGKVSDSGARVFVVIHPLEVPDFYVEPEISVKPDGSWKVVAYIAENKPGFEHKRFEVRAFANPSGALA